MVDIKIRLHMTVNSTQTLGPHARYGIWVQGCMKRCLGCVSPDSQPFDGGYDVSITDLAIDILATPNIEGVTISGGEPFMQEIPLLELIALIKAERNLGIIIYTGMSYNEIKESKLAKASDMIIDGDYQENLNDGLSLRGSANQNIVLITSRYSDDINKYGTSGRRIELHFKNECVTMVGIPDKVTLNALKEKSDS